MVHNKQLDHKHYKHVCPKGYPELDYIPQMIVSSIIFTIPWTIQKLYVGISGNDSSKNLKVASLLLLSLCFYLPSLVPIHMWKKSRKVRPCNTDLGNRYDAEGHVIQFSSFSGEGSGFFVPARKKHKNPANWAKFEGACVKIA